jgi:pyridoxal phosphate enzyme (YggS family)
MAGSFVEQNWRNILATMQEVGKTWGDRPGQVKVVVASKFQPLERLREVFALGLHAFGENYLQDALRKRELLSDMPIEWHFFGRIQSNKAKDLVGQFALIHSVGRKKILTSIQAKAAELGHVQSVLLQVNLYDEATKDGFSEQEVKMVLADANRYHNVKICGLMFFPPLTEDEEVARKQFRRAKSLFDEVKGWLSEKENPILSMGTSSDYRAALLEGSNCLRLGEVLLGDRQQGRTP